ncbi:hydrogenase expression/formation protein [Pseudorhodoferax sp.]|uniref:hydrogenase expression/formation protein n=1 Tax=Pseudorhodoferax sp. TaxID=1993553 RepID=UPI002DD621CC|nr:hydrogenase expression/formation C-terminal domain-containing protein [Pseudorhodoferax sp.]
MDTSPHSRGKPIAIPVVGLPLPSLGPGSQGEDDGLSYMAMPQGMGTYRPPLLPEPEALHGRGGALRVLQAVLAATAGQGPAVVPLQGLNVEERTLVNQVLGEGEVSAQWLPAADDARAAQVQESVFAGVWRVLVQDGQGGVADHIEVGAVPALLRQAAQHDGHHPPQVNHAPPPDVLNAQHVLAELAQHRAAWQPGQPSAVINLTLLPMSPADIAWMDHVLGTGRVLILSRGYGNCRITSTGVPHTWRVVFYNSQDHVILNTVEVGDLPAVAQAAPEDLADSHERLAEVLQWVADA